MKISNRKWLILMIVLVICLCGCSLYKQNKSSYSADNKRKSSNEVVIPNSFDVSEGEGIKINGTLLNDGSNPKVDTLSSDLSTTNKKDMEYGTKLVYSYNIHIDSLDLISSIADTEDLITTYSGYIENSSSENTNKNKFYNAEIRIPAEGAEDFLNALENIGNITSKSSSVSDKTLTYIDLESTKNSYKEELSILSDLSKKADNVADLLEIEREMASIRAEIDSLETITRTINKQVEYSFIRLSISEVDEIIDGNPGLIDKIKERGSDSSDRITDLIADFVVELPILFIACLLYLIIFGLPIFLIVFIVSKVCKKLKLKNVQKTTVVDEKINNASEDITDNV